MKSLFRMNILPIFRGLFSGMIRFHGSSTRSPRSRAHFTMFIHMLECLNKSQIFINISANSCVIDRRMAKHLLVINDKCSSQSKTSINKDTIVSRDILREIGKKLDLEIFSETTFSSWSLHVRLMREVTVD